MSKFFVTLKYRNKRYSFWNEFYAWDDNRPASYVAEWIYTEGNYSCDCNRSSFIGCYCDGRFPKMRCGRRIKLISIREAGTRQPRFIRRRKQMIFQRRTLITNE